MSEVNEEVIRKMANLARLELSEEEIKTFTPQFQKIIMYVETLSEVAVSPSEDPSLIDEIEPMTIPLEIQTPLRPDVVHEFGLDDNGTPKVLNGAPDVLYDGYKVPAIL